MANDIMRQIAKEIVRIWEENPDIDWSGLIEEIKLMCEEEREGVIHDCT